MRKVNKVHAILVGDIHLQDSQPVCRTDVFSETQIKKLNWLTGLQEKYQCPILQAGDLFDYWKTSPNLLSTTLEHLPNNMYTIYGNHDLPQHQMDLKHKCGLYTLEKAGKINIMPTGHWEQAPDGSSFEIKVNSNLTRYILVWHVMAFETKEGDWQSGFSARGILRKYGHDLVLTGHNHKPFTFTFKDKLLVNAGSFFRLEASQINYKPAVYLYFGETNTIEPVYVPIDLNAITREHLELKQERDNRILAFTSSFENDWQATVSFEQNLLRFLSTNNTRKSVKTIIQQALDS